MALRDLDRNAEAIVELEELVKAGVTAVNVTGTLGTAYLDAGRFDAATTMLTMATEGVASRPDLHIALARAHRLAGRLADADQALTRALPPGADREASTFYETAEADLHLETGLVRLAQDRHDGAEEELKEALRLRPTHGPTLRHLAEVYLQMGRREDAARHAADAREAGETLSAALAALVP
jgi:predicted Zn-dependent protease